jgi:ABC-type branched-subunit amino acid transport system permease subunit
MIKTCGLALGEVIAGIAGALYVYHSSKSEPRGATAQFRFLIRPQVVGSGVTLSLIGAKREP